MENLKGIEECRTSLSSIVQSNCQSSFHGQRLASGWNESHDDDDDAYEKTVIEMEEFLGNDEEIRSFIQSMETDEVCNTKTPSLDLNCNEVKHTSGVECVDLCSSDDELDDQSRMSSAAVFNSVLPKNPFYNGKLFSPPCIKLKSESSCIPDGDFVENTGSKCLSHEIPLNVIPSTVPLKSSSGCGDFDSMKVCDYDVSGNTECLDIICSNRSISKSASNCLNLNGSEGFDEYADSPPSYYSDSNSIDINSPSPFTERLLLSEGDADSLLEPAHLSECKEKNSVLRTSEQFDKEIKFTNSGSFLDVQFGKQDLTAPCESEEAVGITPTASDSVLEAASQPEAASKHGPVSKPAALFLPKIPSPPSPPKISPSPPHIIPPVPSPPAPFSLLSSVLPPVPSPPAPPYLSATPPTPPLSAVPSPPSVPSFLDSNAPVPPPPSPSFLQHTSALPSPPISPFLLSAVPQKSEVEKYSTSNGALLPHAPIVDLTVNDYEAPAVSKSDKESVSSGHHQHNAEPAKPSWAEPWISTDAAENADNNDPQWELLRKLETDEERYRSVREKWRQLSIPDPRRDLTRHNFRRSRSQNSREVGGAKHRQLVLNDATQSRKRSRSLEHPDFGNPSKRRRMLSCTSTFETKIDELRKQLDDDVASIRDEQQRALYNLGIIQQRQQDLVMNLNAPHYIVNREISNLYSRQEKEVDDLRIKFDGKLERLFKGKMESINLLRSASKEVHAFNKFYQDLDSASGDDDHLLITEEELEQFQETEQMYEMFDQMYTK